MKEAVFGFAGKNSPPMLNISGIAFSSYAVTDMARARRFYEGVLGLKPAVLNDFATGQWAEYNVGSQTLSLSSSTDFKPGPDGGSVALEVEDWEPALAHLRANNVKFRMEPLTTPVCHMAVISDPDGNRIYIHKRTAN